MKKQHLAPTAACPLLRHFSSVHTSLFEHLALRDVILLLSTCRSLRGDHEAAAVALQTNAVTRHFFGGCMRDWCKTTPTFSFQYCCNASCVHQDNPWDDDALLPSKRVALLSLTGLMASTLKDALYSTKTGNVNTWQVIPFVIPVGACANGSESDLRGALETIEPELVTAFFQVNEYCSEPGLHWQNLEVSADGNTVKCRFCGMSTQEVVNFCGDGMLYWDERDRMHVEDVEGVSDADEREEIKQSMEESDAFYDRQLVDDQQRPDIISHLYTRDELPLLELMQPKTPRVTECVAGASADGYHGDLCPRVYRPLRRLFSTNGFQHVRRVKTALVKASDELPRDEICSVEMIGGVALHGFFAGVYLVEIYA